MPYLMLRFRGNKTSNADGAEKKKDDDVDDGIDGIEVAELANVQGKMDEYPVRMLTFIDNFRCVMFP